MTTPRFIMGKSRLGGLGSSSAGSGPSSSRTLGGGGGHPSARGATLDFIPDVDDDANIPEYSSPDDVCPVCKTDRFRNPKLRLMVSSCYHKMCESCMDRIFSLGPEPCPVCHTVIRKAHFKPQRFEDLKVQKELAIRKKMARTFNKTEQDFVSAEAYDKYLEEVEAWTFKLIQEQDVEETEAAIRRYLEENRDSIEANAEQSQRDKEALKRLDELEKQEREEARRTYEKWDEEDRKAKEQERKAVLEALESSNVNADSLIKQARASALKRSSARLASTATNKGAGGNDLSASMRFFSGLKSGATSSDEVATEDILAELSWYDSYEQLYDLRKRGDAQGYDEDTGLAVEQEKSDEGGFVVEEVWEKAIRASHEPEGQWGADAGKAVGKARLLLALRESVTSGATTSQAELDISRVEAGLNPATVKSEFIAVAKAKAREIHAILSTPTVEAEAKIGTLAFWSRGLAPVVADLAVFASTSQEALVELARGARPSDVLDEADRRDAGGGLYVWQGRSTDVYTGITLCLEDRLHSYDYHMSTWH
ncbi:TFIIH/NER complex subunit [Microbotryomycetes sp. JL201]|nr:TFIIH/NER complex subunit [Microbotryomycetes sp. JL201]